MQVAIKILSAVGKIVGVTSAINPEIFGISAQKGVIIVLVSSCLKDVINSVLICLEKLATPNVPK